jgi:hypothetical protein
MTNPAPPTPGAPERVSISCPGCGRHNWVSWPVGQATLAYTCFNCHKTSELHRKGSGH